MKRIVFPLIAFTSLCILDWNIALIAAGAFFITICMVFVIMTEIRWQKARLSNEAWSLDGYQSLDKKERLKKIVEFINTQKIIEANDRFFYTLIAPDHSKAVFDVTTKKLEIKGYMPDSKSMLDDLKIRQDIGLYFETLVKKNEMDSGRLIVSLDSSEDLTKLQNTILTLFMIFGLLCLIGFTWQLSERMDGGGVIGVLVFIFYLMAYAMS